MKIQEKSLEYYCKMTSQTLIHMLYTCIPLDVLRHHLTHLRGRRPTQNIRLKAFIELEHIAGQSLPDKRSLTNDYSKPNVECNIIQQTQLSH